MNRLITMAAIMVGLALFGACAGRAQSTSAPPKADGEPPSTDSTAVVAQPPTNSISWVTSNSAERAAEIFIEVTRPARAPSALLNGHRAGEARVVVPLDWTVRWNWRNADPTSPHSLVLMVQREKIP